MPNETLITEIENVLSEVIRLGGENERSQIVPNLTVQDANPTGLSDYVIVSDDRDGDNIPAQKVGSVVYSDNDLVNVMFLKGGEAVAFQQGSASSNNGIWEIVPSTSTDIYYDKGDVSIGKSVAPDAALEVLDTSQAQLRLTFEESVKFADFTLNTNHDLTIKPSSTGQIIFQPTTDSTDFLQVLDADGGTPVLNVDSTNERVGIGTATPSGPLHSSGTGLRAIFGDGTGNAFIEFDGGVSSRDIRYQTNGTNRWVFRVDGTAESGSNAGSNFLISRRADDGSLLSTAFTILRQSGYTGINQATPTTQLEVNQNSASAAVSVLRLNQSDVSEPFTFYQGSAAAATLTQSIVAEADVTTATRQGFIKIEIQDDGNQVTDQAYYIPFFTLA